MYFDLESWYIDYVLVICRTITVKLKPNNYFNMEYIRYTFLSPGEALAAILEMKNKYDLVTTDFRMYRLREK